MTAPVNQDSLTSAATAYLLAQPEILELVGKYPPTEEPFIWMMTPIYAIKGSSMSGIVVSKQGNWLQGNPNGTGRYPMLSVEFYVDSIRDPAGNPTLDNNEVERRADQLFRVVDKKLHRPNGGAAVWGDGVITSICIRLAEPDWHFRRDDDKMIYGKALYGLEQIT